MAELRTGRVIRIDAKVCQVEVDGSVLQAAPRGVLFHGEEKNPVAVGDIVEVDPATSPAGLERVLPRRNWLSRTASTHDPREQVLAANVDQVIVVASLTRPGFSSGRVDRILAAAAWSEIPAALVLNKIDLADASEAAEIERTYSAIPIPVVLTCALDGRGIEELRDLMRGKVSVLYGASGAGKSTLLNRIQPGLNIKVGKVSKYWETGKHTTSASQMHALEFGGFVVDTPGVRMFRTFGLTASNVRGLFPDIARIQAHCKFPDCSHDHEPGCAVFDAVESRALAASRYASYVEMLDELSKAAPLDDSPAPPLDDDE